MLNFIERQCFSFNRMSIPSLFSRKHKEYSSEIVTPFPRKFLPLETIYSDKTSTILHSKIRILQFNILADGLSGLRKDLGAFSRIERNDMIWENRQDRLLLEMKQYTPDIITLQEVDHYYDYFLPILSSLGYDGFYSPKPASACLEISTNSDGCCVFVRRDKLRVVSAEVINF